MPKKMLKRFMIAEEKLMQNNTLRYVSNSILQHNVWHLNRRSAGRAVLIGLFFAFLPIPFQMVPAALFCILLRANLPLSIALVWITNPITTPPILYAAYKIGAFLLGVETIKFHMNFTWVMDSVHLMWKPLLLGCLLMSVSFASIGYTIIDLLWRWTTIKRWNLRRKKRLKRSHS
jgi:hypothetical protein